MPAIKHKKTPTRRAVAEEQDEPVFESQSVSRSMQTASRPTYVTVVLLMAISFFAGYLLFKVMSLQDKVKELQAGNTVGQNAAAPQPPKEIKIRKPEQNEPWRGEKNARYVWVEYSDYECPFCKRNHPDLVKLMGEYKDKVGWIYRDYPLAFHPKAQKSAEASQCVYSLSGNDAFWKFTDAIFEKMPDIELTQLPDLAEEIGVNRNAFQDCLDSGKMEKIVKDDLNEGTKAGIQATPTGVIYDTKTGKSIVVEGALPYESLKQSLDDFMKENS